MNDRLRIISDNDQDLAQADEWWRTSSLEYKLAVWACIQRHYDDPAMEVMSRLAQLAFGQLTERMAVK